jgi:hypothetical protein
MICYLTDLTHISLCRTQDEALNVMQRDIGNVTETTEQMFEFHPGRSITNYKNLTHLPFQLQVTYRRMDGMQCLRVISKRLPITSERKAAESKANLQILTANAMQQSSAMCAKGMYRHARQANRRYGRHMMRSCESNADESSRQMVGLWAQDASRFDDMLHVQDQQLRTALRSQGLDSSEDSDSDDGAAPAPRIAEGAPRAPRPALQKKKMVRSQLAKTNRDDSMYQAMASKSRVSSRTYSHAPKSQPKKSEPKKSVPRRTSKSPPNRRSPRSSRSNLG